MSLKLYLHELRDMVDDRKLELELPKTALDFQGDLFTPLTIPLLKLTLQREGSSVNVLGRLYGQWSVPCSRCLKPTDVVLDLAFEDTWFLQPSDEGAQDFFASAFVEDGGESINVLEYGMEVLLEHLPMRVLCHAECLGLCSACGANLNEDECDCGKRDIDPRLAVLGRLLNNKGGVRDGTT